MLCYQLVSNLLFVFVVALLLVVCCERSVNHGANSHVNRRVNHGVIRHVNRRVNRGVIRFV